MLEHIHYRRYRDNGVAGIVDIDELVGAVQILLRPHSQRKRLRFVAGIFHLVDMPVRT